MPPKKAATKAAAKANSSAKVTKPAPTKTKSTKTASTKKAPAPPTRPTSKRAAAQPKAAPAPAPAKAKPAATKKAAPKKAAASATTTTTTKKAAPTTTAASKGIKRKTRDDDDDVEEPAAKKPAVKKAAAATTKKKTAAATQKPAAKKAAPKKTSAATKKSTKSKAVSESAAESEEEAPKKAAPASRKRKTEAAAPAAPDKKAKVLKKGPVINEPPTQRLQVFVFGEGTAGELGLGTAKNAIDVKRPRLNANLDAEKVGVVQIVGGGMHVIALTHDNKILTWGVNDQGALGRDCTWDGGLKDMDAAAEEDSDDEDEDNGLNPKESTPGEVDFSMADVPEGTRWVQVAAGDSCSWALTDDGRVYGWGTFRANEGVFGFNPTTEIAYRPVLNPDLKKITSIVAGANHVLALDSNGAVFAWGSGQQNQLGRRIVERTKLEGLRAREFGLPKGPKKGIVMIETGSYHSFAIDRNGNVYSWGLNNYGETGIPDNAGDDDALILKPQIVESLQGKTITSIKGGGHHSLCATSDGDCLIWGRIDGNQIGIAQEELAKMSDDVVTKDEHGKPRILKIPQKIAAIEGAVTQVATSSDHNVVVTKEGKAWSWGFSANYQTGQGQVEDVKVATMIDNTATRDKILSGATTGGQYGILTAAA